MVVPVPVLLEAAAAVLATWGWIRAHALEQLLPDARLRRLQWFFGLLAMATAIHLVFLLHPWAEGAPWRPTRDRIGTLLLWVHHALLTSAMVVAVRAYGPVGARGGRGDGAAQDIDPGADNLRDAPRTLAVWPLPVTWFLLQAERVRRTRPPGGFSPLLFGSFALLRLLEAGLALYIAIRALANQRSRRNRRSLLVAGGFLAIFLAHAGFWLLNLDLRPRNTVAEAAFAFGILLLVSALPRPPRGL